MDTELQNRISIIKRGLIPDNYIKKDSITIPIEWKYDQLKNLVVVIKKSVTVEPEKSYKQIGVRSHGKGIFYKEEVAGIVLGSKSVFWIEPECFIVNIVFAWEMAIAKTTKNEIGMIASHRFPMFKPDSNKLNLDFLTYYFKSPRGNKMLELASPGGAGRNKTLGQGEFLKLSIPVPPINEQHRISQILLTWDKAIGLKEQLLEEKKRQKKGLIEKLLTGKLRLPGFEEIWEEFKLKDLLMYEQPTKYITKDLIDYSDSLTPVLTANKAFILGSTNEDEGIYKKVPVIIFDDFTTDCKYVDFEFKVRSSAIKILSSKNNCNIRFMFEFIQLMNIECSDHKRYYISQYQEKIVAVPSIAEQNQITQIIIMVDKEIELCQKELEALKLQKKGLMQLLLTGIVRVNLETN